MWAQNCHSLRFDLMSASGRKLAIGNLIHRPETSTLAQHDRVVPKAVPKNGPTHCYHLIYSENWVKMAHRGGGSYPDYSTMHKLV